MCAEFLLQNFDYVFLCYVSTVKDETLVCGLRDGYCSEVSFCNVSDVNHTLVQFDNRKVVVEDVSYAFRSCVASLAHRRAGDEGWAQSD
jgi:hypothetical protein